MINSIGSTNSAGIIDRPNCTVASTLPIALWQARITGHIRPIDCDQSIELNAEYGVLEQHYAKW